MSSTFLRGLPLLPWFSNFKPEVINAGLPLFLGEVFDTVEIFLGLPLPFFLATGVISIICFLGLPLPFLGVLTISVLIFLE